VSRYQANSARIDKAARRWICTPYHDQASVRGVRCDSLGLLRGVWRDVVGPEPMPVPPYSRDWGETGPVEVLAEAARAAMPELNLTEARTGDVILFRMRAGAIAKHVGILSSRKSFIHAYERTGVIEEHLTPAWQRRIAFAFRFPVR
jgi:NlpC/P60 family putative phage cell wall peptidase